MLTIHPLGSEVVNVSVMGEAKIETDGKFQWHQVERIYSKFLESKWNNCTSIGLE